jgi:hypothetical protein
MRPDMERVVEHIESKWCASVLGEDLIYVIRGTDNPSSNSAVSLPQAVLRVLDNIELKNRT